MQVGLWVPGSTENDGEVPWIGKHIIQIKSDSTHIRIRSHGKYVLLARASAAR